MAFRFKRSENIQANFKRLAGKELKVAIDSFEAAHLGNTAAVGTAHIPLTRLYTLYYLCRAGFDQAEYRREITGLKTALATLKRRTSPNQLIETLDSLRQQAIAQRNANPWDNVQHWLVDSRDFVSLNDWEIVRNWLAGRHDSLVALNGDNPWAVLAAQLRQTQLRLEKIHLSHKGWRAIAPGLERLYRRGRKGLSRAPMPNAEGGDTPWSEEWYDWIERFYCQTQLLRSLWPASMGINTREQKRLLVQLNKFHQLTELQKTLQEEFDLPGSDTILRSLHIQIDQRRQSIHQRALLAGRRLFAEKPANYVLRLQAYWLAWKKNEQKPVGLKLL